MNQFSWSSTAGYHSSRVGDFDGDGTHEIMSMQQSGAWWMADFDAAPGSKSVYRGGWGTDPYKPWQSVLVADFDGDGADDILGVQFVSHATNPTQEFRQLWVKTGLDSSNHTNTHWGNYFRYDLDGITVGDFNNDGKADMASLMGYNDKWHVATSNTAGDSFDSPAIYADWFPTVPDDFGVTTADLNPDPSDTGSLPPESLDQGSASGVTDPILKLASFQSYVGDTSITIAIDIDDDTPSRNLNPNIGDYRLKVQRVGSSIYSEREVSLLESGYDIHVDVQADHGTHDIRVEVEEWNGSSYGTIVEEVITVTNEFVAPEFDSDGEGLDPLTGISNPMLDDHDPDEYHVTVHTDAFPNILDVQARASKPNGWHPYPTVSYGFADDSNEYLGANHHPSGLYHIDSQTGQITQAGNLTPGNYTFDIIARSTIDHSLTDTATVFLTVVDNYAPVAVDDTGYYYTNPNSNQTTWVNYFVLAGDTLAVNANDGVLKNDFDNDFEESDSLNAVLDSNGQYGTATLNSDGSFTYTPNSSVFDGPFNGLVDTFTYIVTDPQSAVSNVATVAVNLASIEIQKEVKDPTDPFLYLYESVDSIDFSSENSKPWVGELVTLRAKVIGNVSPSSFMWDISSYAVKDYEVFVPGAPQITNEHVGTESRLTPLLTDDLNDQSVEFYWVSGGEKEVSVEVDLPGGKSTEVESGLTVIKPEVGWSVEVGEPKLSVENDLVKIQLLSSSQNGPGARFSVDFGVDPNTGFSNTRYYPADGSDDRGDYLLTQTVNNHSRRYFAEQIGVEFNGFGIDSQFKYPFGSTATWEDSPSASFHEDAYYQFTREDSFTSYLMYNPERGRSNIYVPLRVLNWGAGFSVIESEGEWSIEALYGTLNRTVSGYDTVEFPQFSVTILSLYLDEEEWYPFALGI